MRTLAILLAAICLFGLPAQAADLSDTTVLVEAEGFQEHGGWVVDQQSMDQMGSPYLLAHGMGVAVEDAATTVKFPAMGEYRVLVRTRNWVAPWTPEYSPGKFQVLVSGKPLATTFGTEGAEWHWQDGGTVRIDYPMADVGLHDLTGFEGRCDAIVFTRDPSFMPPNSDPTMAAFRRQMLGLSEEPVDGGQFDFVVVGGGIAGLCSAISAARLGCQVALIHNRPVLGGNNSSESRVHLSGKLNQLPYPNLGNLVLEVGPRRRGNAQPADYYEDERKLSVAQAEKNLHLFLNTHAYRVDTQGSQITAIVGRNIRTGVETRFTAPLFADCTGDGTVGFLAGADFRMGRESQAETGESLAPEEADKLTMGSSVQWYAEKENAPMPFPECPWAIQVSEKSCHRDIQGEWNWETGMNKDQVTEFEEVRDHGLRAVYGNWAYIKNHDEQQEFTDQALSWVAYVAGKRESRRLLGDVILREQDIIDRTDFPDACVTCTWTIDLHYPHPDNTKYFPGEEFRTIAHHVKIEPYPLPYRCLYSRNINNLMMAGRDISVTHVALGTVRVMMTTGMMGEVLGMAASLCTNHDTNPRGVYESHLDELKTLMEAGIGTPPPPPIPSVPPKWLPTAGKNLARDAEITVSGNHDIKRYPPSHINDGEINVKDNNTRWVSDKTRPSWVELSWDAPREVNAARILTGQSGRGEPTTPITEFVLQYHNGRDWVGIEETEEYLNERIDWNATFPTVTTDRMRLYINRTSGGLARIWELELYRLP